MNEKDILKEIEAFKKRGGFKYKKGKGFKWHDGTIIPTTIMTDKFFGIYEYPTNPSDRMIVSQLERIGERGLHFPLHHLEKIRYLIVYSPIERQAKYADAICQKNISDIDFIKFQFENISETDLNNISLFESFNATSVGNLAYLSLHAPKEYADKAIKMLANYTNFVKTLLDGGIDE